MTIGIIDDETANRLVIRSILTTFCTFADITVEEGLVDKAVQMLNGKKPEVVFLDIELKNGTGFDIIQQLTYKPEIIFTTAYSQYAINAIKIRAFDYLLKPINEEELIKSLEQCRLKLKEQKENSLPAIGDSFFNMATNEGKLSLNYNDIFYFESSGSYTYCATLHKKLIFSKNIGEVEKELAKNVFFRVHHSFIVNLSKINRIELKRNGRLHLTNQEVVPLAQRKIKEFKEIFKMNSTKKA